MYSVDFAEIEKLQHEGKWDEATELMIVAGKRLENGGADCILICTNTMHKMAGAVEENTGIPLLHIADATARRIQERGIKTIGLLGTKFTMEEDFYKGRLAQRYGLEVLIPSVSERQIVHDVIYEELCLGRILPTSKEKFITIINNLAQNGAEAVILGCTEIPLLIQQTDVNIPLFDTTRIHAESAVDFALSEN